MSSRNARTLAIGLIVSAWLFVVLRLPPLMAGDGVEYVSVSEAWLNHATPDLRPSDYAWLDPLIGPEMAALLPKPTVTTAGGAVLGLHFWLYPLLVLPNKLLLQLGGLDWFHAFQATNVALFGLALYVTLFHHHTAPRRRWMLAGLSAVGPVIWYLRWPHPEVFTWACVLISLVCLNNRRHALAAAAAALGAMQNPPVIFLAAYAVAVSFFAAGLGSAARTAAVAALALVPTLFYLVAIGSPSPIAAIGLTSASYVSLSRTWSFFTDLNQGLMPYVPFLLVLAALGAGRAVVRRDARVAGMAVALLLMILGVQSIYQWQSGCAGLMRYAVWMIPVFAWLAAEGLPDTAWASRAAGTTMIAHAGLLGLHGFGASQPICGFPLHEDPPDLACHLAHRPLASFVMARWPAFYDPDPEIFATRQLGRDGAGDEAAASGQPVAFIRPDGVVTKILVDARSVSRLSDFFTVDPAYAAQAARDGQTHSGPFYLHPPDGAVQSLCPPRAVPAGTFLGTIDIAASKLPEWIESPRFALDVTMTNRGADVICNLGAGSAHWLSISYRILEDGNVIVPGGIRTRAADILRPGQAVTSSVMVVVPERVGRYLVEVLPVLESVAWGEHAARLSVEVVETGGGRFRARVSESTASTDRSA